MSTLRLYVENDGIALITINDPNRPMNVMCPEWMEEMIASIEKIASDDKIKGAIITSAKPAFMAGADLKFFLEQMESGMSLREAYDFSQRASVAMHRRLETCGKPFVAAINGLALGGGYELCLACHYRVLVDDPKAIVGLPEATVGLLAGSGGTQRLPRMIGILNSLPYVVEGKTVGPAAALEAGLVDCVVPQQELLQAARDWINTAANPVKAWDNKDYKLPEGSGLLNSDVAASYSMWVARITARHYHNYPSYITNLDTVFQGSLMPFDKALSYESKQFAVMVNDVTARNIIRTKFVNKGLADKLARRPEGIAKKIITLIGVVGAGLMGSGIAYAAARVGLNVVLIDRDQAAADKGKQYSEKLVAKAVQRGRMTQEKADQLLSFIKPTVDYANLKDCQLVIEAVFEDRALKAEVTAKIEAAISPDAILASNTSTLPITGLAEASSRPDKFIGLHFFSPVDRMPLIEVINGEQTSQTTLAHSLDLVGLLRMTPVVVNDARGFYTSRVFQTFIHEGMRMVEEGVAPALIENAAKIAGMPIGPLALLDEVTVELPWKIVQQSIDDLGDAYSLPCAYNVMQTMVEKLGRIGRRSGGGFYDYPEGGGKHIWPGLKDIYPVADYQPDLDEVRKRLLYIQALETARCMEEGVLTHPVDGDLGSILGWGFPSYTGGTLSYIDTLGIAPFVTECERLADQYGERFRPSAWMSSRVEQGEEFY